MSATATQLITIERNVPATMRDGTTLRANVYRPGGDGRHPTLLTRLPYGKDLFGSGGGYADPIKLAGQGYVVVAQDVRGRFASEGAWTPFVHEFADGYDSVEWAARLPGSDGRVAMFGVSYLGMTQWQAAVMAPPALRGIVPGITWGNYLNGCSFRGGARELGSAWYWAQTIVGFDVLFRKYGAGGDPTELQRQFLGQVARIDDIIASYDTLPLAALPDPAGVSPTTFEWLRRPIDDPFWGELGLDGRYDAVRVPTLQIGGWYDIFLGETLRQYAAMRETAAARGLRAPRLVIGPWVHGRYDPVVGDLAFGLASSGMLLNYRGDLTDLHLRWYDAVLNGNDAALAEQPPMEVFVMGENRWRGFDRWPVPGAREDRWYFHGGSGTDGDAGDGALSRERPGQEPPDSYAYDPRDPVPTIGGATLMPALILSGPRDQRPNEGRRDILRYTSAPLERDYTVIGPVSVALFAASSAPDTDFVARLVDVHPDGRAFNVTDGVIRASARASYPAPGVIRPTRPSPIEPDRPYEYAIDLWATGSTFRAGHRLRVEITSSNFPRWDRNLNTGEDSVLSAATAVAHQRVFHDADRPSHLTLAAVAE